MSAEKKRKRRPVISYRAPGKLFDRLLEEESLKELQKALRQKLGLADKDAIQLQQVRDGESISLDDEEDFRAFQEMAYRNEFMVVKINSGYVPTATKPTQGVVEDEMASPRKAKKRKLNRQGYDVEVLNESSSAEVARELGIVPTPPVTEGNGVQATPTTTPVATSTPAPTKDTPKERKRTRKTPKKVAAAAVEESAALATPSVPPPAQQPSTAPSIPQQPLAVGVPTSETPVQKKKRKSTKAAMTPANKNATTNGATTEMPQSGTSTAVVPPPTATSTQVPTVASQPAAPVEPVIPPESHKKEKKTKTPKEKKQKTPSDKDSEPKRKKSKVNGQVDGSDKTGSTSGKDTPSQDSQSQKNVDEIWQSVIANSKARLLPSLQKARTETSSRMSQNPDSTSSLADDSSHSKEVELRERAESVVPASEVTGVGRESSFDHIVQPMGSAASSVQTAVEPVHVDDPDEEEEEEKSKEHQSNVENEDSETEPDNDDEVAVGPENVDIDAKIEALMQGPKISIRDIIPSSEEDEEDDGKRKKKRKRSESTDSDEEEDQEEEETTPRASRSRKSAVSSRRQSGVGAEEDSSADEREAIDEGDGPVVESSVPDETQQTLPPVVESSQPDERAQGVSPAEEMDSGEMQVAPILVTAALQHSPVLPATTPIIRSISADLQTVESQIRVESSRTSTAELETIDRPPASSPIEDSERWDRFSQPATPATITRAVAKGLRSSTRGTRSFVDLDTPMSTTMSTGRAMTSREALESPHVVKAPAKNLSRIQEESLATGNGSSSSVPPPPVQESEKAPEQEPEQEPARKKGGRAKLSEEEKAQRALEKEEKARVARENREAKKRATSVGPATAAAVLPDSAVQTRTRTRGQSVPLSAPEAQSDVEGTAKAKRSGVRLSEAVKAERAAAKEALKAQKAADKEAAKAAKEAAKAAKAAEKEAAKATKAAASKKKTGAKANPETPLTIDGAPEVALEVPNPDQSLTQWAVLDPPTDSSLQHSQEVNPQIAPEPVHPQSPSSQIDELASEHDVGTHKSAKEQAPRMKPPMPKNVTRPISLSQQASSPKTNKGALNGILSSVFGPPVPAPLSPGKEQPKAVSRPPIINPGFPTLSSLKLSSSQRVPSSSQISHTTVKQAVTNYDDDDDDEEDSDDSSDSDEQSASQIPASRRAGARVVKTSRRMLSYA